MSGAEEYVNVLDVSKLNDLEIFIQFEFQGEEYSGICKVVEE